jgi:hypothetical protein
MATTNFPFGITSGGTPVVGGIGDIPFNGNFYFVDYVNGADGNDGSSATPMKTLQAAHDRCIDGNNDVVIIVGDGTATGSQRLSTTLTWTKNATHLFGMCSPTEYSQRARIAPVSGTTAFADFVTVSGSGCYFANFQVFDGFATGTTNQIAWADSGSRNVYQNVHFAGMGDTQSATDTGSRSLKLTGQESVFQNCTVGIDTVTRTVANASLEFASGATRHIFRECTFPFMTSSATVVGIKTAAASAIDRTIRFERCSFENAVGSTSTTMTGIAIMAASAGGLLLFKDCTAVGINNFGYDATTNGQCYIDGAVPNGNTTGIAVATA